MRQPQIMGARACPVTLFEKRRGARARGEEVAVTGLEYTSIILILNNYYIYFTFTSKRISREQNVRASGTMYHVP